MERPRSEQEIVALVRRARSERRPLRVHGARHSIAPTIGTGRAGGLEVRLDRMTAIEIDDRIVTVSGGARIGGDPADRTGLAARANGLCEALTRRGLALPNLAGITHQTVAGFLATGSAGSGVLHALDERVRAVRLVDGRGELQEWRAGDPRFPFACASLGLLGVVTAIELEAEPTYDVVGEEVTIGREDAPFDLEASGDRSVFRFLAQHEYARILWWPQVEKFVVWSARRAGPGDYDRQSGPPGLLRPRPYEPLPAAFGSTRPAQLLAALAMRGLDRGLVDPRRARKLVEAFLPTGRRSFFDRWDRALPMDDLVDERLLPIELAELWFPESDAAEALGRLDRFLRRYDAAGNFAIEIYAGARSPFALAPGEGRPGLRINFLHDARAVVAAPTRFLPIWDLFEDLAPRLHWGKHLPPPPRTAPWIARAWPRIDDFHALRDEADPQQIFPSDYLRARFAIAEPRTAVSAPRKPVSDRVGDDRAIEIGGPVGKAVFRFPMPFALEPVDLAFRAEASRRMTFAVETTADPELLYDAFVDMERASEWLEHFVGFVRAGDGVGAPFEETFTFLRFRARTLLDERPRRWAAVFEVASLPLASRMIEEIEIMRSPSGRTTFVWTFHLDPHPLARPFEAILRPLFERFFQRGLDGLARWAERRSAILRRPWLDQAETSA
jgi:D-arabinono-1,4-lactone oxidase